VLTGEPLDRIRAENTERNLAGVAPSRESRGTGTYEGEHRRRQIEIAVQLFQAWASPETTPSGARIGYCGALVNGLVNAAWSRGLGCVVNSQGIMHSPVVREHAGIPEDEVIMICVAMGYPDEEFPANAVVSRRRPVEEVASFVGFEG